MIETAIIASANKESLLFFRYPYYYDKGHPQNGDANIPMAVAAEVITPNLHSVKSNIW